MKRKHLLEELLEHYGGHIHNTAKKMLIAGVLLEDMKSELLLAVYGSVVRNGWEISEASRIVTSITGRGLDLRRKYSRQSLHHQPSGAIPKELSHLIGAEEVGIPRESREKELRRLLKQKVGGLDARIAIELVFPSSKTRAYARRRPTFGKRALRKGKHHPEAVVQKWHVAEVLGISRRQVAEGLRNVASRLLSSTYNWLGELNGQSKNKKSLTKGKKRKK